MNPMMISGTQNVMSWPRMYLTVTTTFMTVSLATRPTSMPMITETSRMKGRLVSTFFMTAVLLLSFKPFDMEAYFTTMKRFLAKKDRSSARAAEYTERGAKAARRPRDALSEICATRETHTCR